MNPLQLFQSYWSASLVEVNLLVFANLVGALLLGLLVGYERSYHGRAAGMRTYGIVCMASAALTVFSGAFGLAIGFGLQGPTFAVSSACASSNHAIGLAFQQIRSGSARVMLAGGSDAMLCFGGIKAWEGLRVMSKDASGLPAPRAMASARPA